MGTTVPELNSRWLATGGANTEGGVPSVTGLTASEVGNVVRRTTLNFSNVAFALTDVAATVAYSGKKVFDFPEGQIVILSAVADLDLTKSAAGVNADWDGDFSVGTVTASNNATLTSTEANIIPSTATPQAAAGVTTANGQNTGVAVLDGTNTAADLYLNLLVDDADQDVTGTPTSLIVNGTLTVTWIKGGDY
jgi:hypothetical protein